MGGDSVCVTSGLSVQSHLVSRCGKGERTERITGDGGLSGTSANRAAQCHWLPHDSAFFHARGLHAKREGVT